MTVSLLSRSVRAMPLGGSQEVYILCWGRSLVKLEALTSWQTCCYRQKRLLGVRQQKVTISTTCW